MLRPIDSTSFTEPTVKAVAVGVRADGGAGEQASASNLEQSSVAIRQAAVVALGNQARALGGGPVDPTSGTYARPASTRPPRPSESSSKLAAVQPPSPPKDASVGDTDTAVLATAPQDPVTLQEVKQLREQALTPPVSAANVQLFERASLDIELAQLQLAHRHTEQEPAATLDGGETVEANANGAIASRSGS